MLAYILAESWAARHENLLVAAAALVVTAITVWAVDRWLAHRVVDAARRVAGGELSPAADTRIRVVRRALNAVIIVLGLTVAISQFGRLSSIASALLASSALVAAVIGFAARQPVANAVAGLVLATTQPVRVGDLVTIGDYRGTVTDVRLTSTVLRLAGGADVIVPNEMFVGGAVRNDSRPGTPIVPEVDLWLGHDTDPAAARTAIAAALPGVEVVVADTTPEGYRLVLIAEAVAATERVGREQALRTAALDAVRGGA